MKFNVAAQDLYSLDNFILIAIARDHLPEIIRVAIQFIGGGVLESATKQLL